MSQLAGGGRTPAAKFSKVGVTFAGVVASEPRDMPVRDFATGEPKTWDNGDPVMQTQVVLDLAEPDADGNDRVAVYVKGRMVKAVKQAIIEAGAPDIEVGGWLRVKRIEDGKATRGYPPHEFEAEYKRPEGTDIPAPDEPEDDGPPF